MAHHKAKYREYEVHVRHRDNFSSRVLKEASSEAAAIAFVEDYGVAVHPEDDAVTVYVRDLKRGGDHCYKIDLHTGLASPCK